MEPSVPQGPVACLARAAEHLRHDPIALLLPVGGLLLCQSVGVLLARGVWAQGLPSWLAAIGLAGVVGVVPAAFLRSRWIAVAARNSGFDVGAWGRPLALLGVQLVVWPLSALATAIPLAPLGAIGLWLGAHGWWALGAVALAAGACAGTLGGTLVRSVFALSAPEVVVGGRSAIEALSIGARRGVRELWPLTLLVVAGDVVTGLGALVCGALALPGYPLTDLAVLHRWRHGALR